MHFLKFEFRYVIYTPYAAPGRRERNAPASSRKDRGVREPGLQRGLSRE
ncbi:MAG: hypothetical protein GY946_18680 [bacterium]|nr:hypothetical protein [bacterium]